MIFSKMKVGKRLAVGFGAALLLLLTISVASELTIRSIAADTTNLLDQQLKTERLVTEWKGYIETNVQRAQAAAKTSDPETQKFFEEGIARASERVSNTQEQIGRLLVDPRAKDLFAKALENRAIYQGHRKAAFDAKARGDIDQANTIIAQQFIPAGDNYVGSISALAERQKSAIDEIGNSIQKRSEGAVVTILLVSLTSIVVALALGWLITRSLLSQLGGEPGYAAAITDRIAAGDLTVNVALRAGDRSSLLFSIASMRDRLAAIVGEVRNTTDAVATASNEIASGNMDLSIRTEQQAGSLEETASSMEELTSTVKQNTDHARQANQLAASASSVAVRGGGVVATVMSNLGLERYLNGLGLNLERTAVGDRHVLERMRSGGYNVGGEQSGHMILLDHATTGDGTVAALQVISALVQSGKRASELLHLFDPVPQLLRNVRFSGGKPLEAGSVKAVIADAEASLVGRGRLVIRPSGTEPVIRVMAEGDDAGEVEAVVASICDAVAEAAA